MSYQLLIFFSIVGYGVGTLFFKLANDHMHPLMVTTVVTSLYVLVTPLAFTFLKFDHTINMPGLLWSLLGGAFTCVGCLGYFYAVKTGAAGETAILTSLYPGLTLALSCLFLGEPFTVKKGIGMVFALISFLILSQK